MFGDSPAWRLVRLIEGLADRTLAVAFMRYELARVAPEDAAAILVELGAWAEARDERSGRALLIASIALAGEEALRFAIAAAAEAKGEHALVQRLIESAPARALDAGARLVPDFAKGRPLTLGERKSLARRRDRQLLARVLRDPHPDVIRIVLGNPSLIEPDVVRLCARRPIAPEVLREVFRSPRWMVRDAVRLAIVKNPCAPLDLALSIVPHLKAQEARDLAASPELPDALRAACGRAVEPRTIH